MTSKEGSLENFYQVMNNLKKLRAEILNYIFTSNNTNLVKNSEWDHTIQFSEEDWIWSIEAAMSNYNNVILSKKVPLE